MASWEKEPQQEISRAPGHENTWEYKGGSLVTVTRTTLKEKLLLSSFGIISAHSPQLLSNPASPEVGWDFPPLGKHIYLENSKVICPLEENGKELLELGWGMKSVAEPLAHAPCMCGQKALNK